MNLRSMNIALLHARLESIRMLASTTPETRNAATIKVREQMKTLQARTGFYRKNLISGVTDRAQLEESDRLMRDYLDGLSQILALESSDHEKAVLIANNEQVQRASAYQEQLTSLREDNSRAALKSGTEAGDVYDHSMNILVSVVVIASILTVILAFSLTRSIVVPMSSSLKLAEDIAAGDLVVR